MTITQNYDDVDEISLKDLVDFVIRAWRTIAAGALVGMILSLMGGVMLSSFKAEAVVSNATATASVNASARFTVSEPPINFVSWKHLQLALPELAARMLASNVVKSDEYAQYSRLSSQKWWNTNVQPVFPVSKNDSKLLPSVSKEFDGAAGSTILYFEISDSASDKDQAEKDLMTSINFMRSASIYWALRSLVRNLDADLQRSEAELLKSIGASEIELGYLVQKSLQYQTLRKSHPRSAVSAERQVVDVKDGGSKYLPLDTQMLAVDTEILSVKEGLTKMRDKVKQLNIMSEFREKALPAAEDHHDGFALGNVLLQIASELRVKLGSAGKVQYQALTELEFDIKSILVRFDKGLRISAKPSASRTRSFLTIGSLGFFAGAMLMLIFVLGRSAWRKSVPQIVEL